MSKREERRMKEKIEEEIEDIKHKNSKRRIKRFSQSKYAWMDLVLTGTTYEKPFLHNGVHVSRLIENEPIFVYYAFCSPGKHNFVVNYVAPA